MVNFMALTGIIEVAHTWSVISTVARRERMENHGALGHRINLMFGYLQIAVIRMVFLLAMKRIFYDI